MIKLPHQIAAGSLMGGGSGDHLGLSPFAKTVSNNTQQTPDDVMIFCFPYPSSGKNNW